MCMGAALAFPAAALYLTFPRLLDRYDPEPWYALLGALAWGALGAAGLSLAFNSTIGGVAALTTGPESADVFSAVFVAPVTEEFFKGLGVWAIFIFLRREFDGLVDGVMYATFVALGFAATENVIYYARAGAEGDLGLIFIMRGVLFPWGHPVYTAMFGLGLGLARETRHGFLRILGPLFGFCGAVLLHATWNGLATLASDEEGALVFFCSLPVWLLFVLFFVAIVIVLVRRRGRIIRDHLQDEVALGNLSQAEVALVGSAFGVSRARRLHGDLGVRFVRAAARLALSKWHATRAHQQSKHTVSMDFILPLRNQLKELRATYLQKSQRGGRT